MKQTILALVICLAAMRCLAQRTEKEKLVRAYYAGFEKHNWSIVARQLAGGFTFTSANNDDHISAKQFEAKCWPTNKFFQKVNLIKMAESGNALYLLVEITTTNHKVVRNIDLFNFTAGKISSIETFFGRGESYPGK